MQIIIVPKIRKITSSTSTKDLGDRGVGVIDSILDHLRPELMLKTLDSTFKRMLTGFDINDFVVRTRTDTESCFDAAPVDWFNVAIVSSPNFTCIDQ